MSKDSNFETSPSGSNCERRETAQIDPTVHHPGAPPQREKSASVQELEVRFVKIVMALV